jgi:hypothetical protein
MHNASADRFAGLFAAVKSPFNQLERPIMNFGKLIYAERTNRRRQRATVAERATPAPGGCQYAVRNADGALEDCNSPATFQGTGGSRKFYCESHGAYVGNRGIAVTRIAPAPVAVNLQHD